MLEREPFLRVIFANPDDDLPRLVFADWLDEHDDPVWAELLRVQCELGRHKIDRSRTDPGSEVESLIEREERLFLQLNAHTALDCFPNYGTTRSADAVPLPIRGFRPCPLLEVAADRLSNSLAFRQHACSDHPEWYGATRLKVTSGRISTPEPLQAILTSPVTEHVVELDLSGHEEAIPQEVEGTRVFDVEIKPVVTVRMVERLAQMREVRRLTVLDLRNNNLDNDALNALAKSTNFLRLKRLLLSTGNYFRGRTWQRVQERFGPDVVE